MAYKVYTKKDCKFCLKAKGVLTGLGLPFIEITEMPDDIRATLLARNHQTYPAIFDPNDIFIGGYAELAKRLLK